MIIEIELTDEEIKKLEENLFPINKEKDVVDAIHLVIENI